MQDTQHIKLQSNHISNGLLLICELWVFEVYLWISSLTKLCKLSYRKLWKYGCTEGDKSVIVDVFEHGKLWYVMKRGSAAVSSPVAGSLQSELAGPALSCLGHFGLVWFGSKGDCHVIDHTADRLRLEPCSCSCWLVIVHGSILLATYKVLTKNALIPNTTQILECPKITFTFTCMYI